MIITGKTLVDPSLSLSGPWCPTHNDLTDCEPRAKNATARSPGKFVILKYIFNKKLYFLLSRQIRAAFRFSCNFFHVKRQRVYIPSRVKCCSIYKKSYTRITMSLLTAIVPQTVCSPRINRKQRQERHGMQCHLDGGWTPASVWHGCCIYDYSVRQYSSRRYRNNDLAVLTATLDAKGAEKC